MTGRPVAWLQLHHIPEPCLRHNVKGCRVGAAVVYGNTHEDVVWR